MLCRKWLQVVGGWLRQCCAGNSQWAQLCGDKLNKALLKNLPWADGKALGSEPSNQLHGDDAVTAKVKKVVAGGNVLAQQDAKKALHKASLGVHLDARRSLCCRKRIGSGDRVQASLLQCLSVGFAAGQQRP